jgi:hypothetical protein
MQLSKEKSKPARAKGCGKAAPLGNPQTQRISTFRTASAATGMSTVLYQMSTTRKPTILLCPRLTYCHKNLVLTLGSTLHLKLWQKTTQFAAEGDWMFASPVKLGRQPISYTFVWESLRHTAMKAGIGHISSHVSPIPAALG